MSFNPPLGSDGYRNRSFAPQPTLGDEVRTVVGTVRDGWRMIAICTLVAMVLMLVYLMLTPAKYVARSELLLDPRQKQVVNSEVVDSNFSLQDNSPDMLLLDSQVQVILSQPVLRKLIDDQDLLNDSEFIPKRRLGGDKDAAYEDVQSSLLKALDVSRETNTYVIGIELKSKSPEKAARLTNRLAQLYLETNAGIVQSATKETAEALQSRLENLRTDANAANQAVEDYRKANGLISSQTGLVSEQQLRDANTQLSLARVATTTAEANLAKVNSAIRNGGSLGNAGLESGVVTQLQLDLSKLELEEAQLRAKYGPKHPEIARITEQKAALKASLNAEYSRVAERLKLDVTAARQNESELRDQVTAFESQTLTSNSASVKLAELEQEAKASQTIYETFLNRSKQVWEQVDLPNDTARIISPAYPPSQKSEPKSAILMAAATVLGLIIGVAIVWMQFILSAGQVRQPRSFKPSMRRPKAIVMQQRAVAPPEPANDGPRPRAWQASMPPRDWR